MTPQEKNAALREWAEAGDSFAIVTTRPRLLALINQLQTAQTVAHTTPLAAATAREILNGLIVAIGATHPQAAKAISANWNAPHPRRN